MLSAIHQHPQNRMLPLAVAFSEIQRREKKNNLALEPQAITDFEEGEVKSSGTITAKKSHIFPRVAMEHRKVIRFTGV